MRPVFFIGNKRSGTSQLTLFLNGHPELFVTNESDVSWMLYQIETGMITDEGLQDRIRRDEEAMGVSFAIAPFSRHPYDIGSAGGVHTMRALQNTTVLSDPMSVRARFEAIQHGYWLSLQIPDHNKSPFGDLIAKTIKGHKWGDYKWVGDKMPTQAADPKVFDFMWRRFPDAKFVHIVRHPEMVVSSMQRLGFNTWWREDTASVLERWTEIEEWVLEAEKTAPVIHVRQEDLVNDVNYEMGRLFEFLDVDPVRYPCQKRHRAKSRPADLQVNDRTRAIMERYDYE